MAPGIPASPVGLTPAGETDTSTTVSLESLTASESRGLIEVA